MTNLVSDELRARLCSLIAERASCGCRVVDGAFSQCERCQLLQLLNAPVEPRCDATWKPFTGGAVVPCTLPAGHTGKHRAPEPFSEEVSLERVTPNQVNFAQAVTGTAMEAGLGKDQFLRLASIAWGVHERSALNRQAEPPREQLVVHHDEDSQENRAAAEKALRERGVQDIRHVTAFDISENKVRLRSDGFVVNRSGDA